MCRRKTTEEFTLDAIKVHGTKYEYSLVDYKNNKTKIEIVCKEHGSYFMRPDSHLIQKQGCPRCSFFKVRNTRSFIEESIKVHGSIYDYSKSKYTKAHDKISIICKEHGEFNMEACCHYTNKQGCPKCGKESMTSKHRKDNWEEDFRKIHGDIYDYSLVEYKNNKTKIKIVCKEHGIFHQSPKGHIRGDGCPNCKSSTGERKIFSILTEKSINFKTQYKFRDCLSDNNVPLRFDFFISEYNIVIEYDGMQHYKPIKFFGGEKSFNLSKIRDNIKNEYCKNNGIKLIRVPYYDFDKIEEYLTF